MALPCPLLPWPYRALFSHRLTVLLFLLKPIFACTIAQNRQKAEKYVERLF